MNKSLLILLFLVILPLANAQLSINPNPVQADVRASVPQNFQITLLNNHTFPIYNITFEPLEGFTFPNNLQLNNGNSLTTNFTINTNSEFQSILTSKIKFNYYITVPNLQATHNVSINPNSFNPSPLNINQGDTVVWKNNGTLNHNIRSNFFDVNLAPGETYSYIFPNTGTYNIQDVSFNFGMDVIVNLANNQQLANNPSFDVNLTINVNSQLIDTAVTLQIIENNLTVKYNGQTEGLLKITNIGDKPAEKVFLTSNSSWVTFDENNFSVNAGENNLVIFKVKPFINAVAETNLTYEIPITTNGINIVPVTSTFKVFIPYESSLIPSNVTREDLIIQIEALKKLLDLFKFENNTIYVYKDPIVPIENLTQEQLYRYISGEENQTDQLRTMFNELKIISDRVNNNSETQSQYNSNLNETNKLYSQSKNDFDDLKVIALIIIPTSILTYIFVNWIGKKKQKMQKQKAEYYKYNITETPLKP